MGNSCSCITEKSQLSFQDDLDVISISENDVKENMRLEMPPITFNKSKLDSIVSPSAKVQLVEARLEPFKFIEGFEVSEFGTMVNNDEGWVYIGQFDSKNQKSGNGILL